MLKGILWFAFAAILGTIIWSCQDNKRHTSSPSPAVTAPRTTQSPDPEGIPIPVSSDPSAKYWVTGNTPLPENHRLVATARQGKSGLSAAIRLVDCDAMTFAYLGEGDTYAQADTMARARMALGLESVPMAELCCSSISEIISRAACQGVGE